MDANDVPSPPGSRRSGPACSSPPPRASGPPLSSSTTTTAVLPPESGRPVDADATPSSPGSRRPEAACSSPPPHASWAPLSSSTPTAMVPPQSGRPVDANDVSSSPGSRRLEAACSSRPTHASGAPLSSSSSSAPYTMPPWTSTTLPELSMSASREEGKQRKLAIEVHLYTKDGLEIVDATFDSSQTVQDLKVYFEKVKGKAVCSAENMVIYHDGTKLSSITTLGSLDLQTWNSILITLQEDINEPTSNLAPAQETTLDEGDYPTWEITNEDLLRFEYDVSASDQEAIEHMMNPVGNTTTQHYDYPSTRGQSDIAEVSTTIGEVSVGIVGAALPESLETANEIFGAPSEQEAAEHMVNHFDSTTIDFDHPSTWSESDIDELANAIGETPTGVAETALTTSETIIVTPSCSKVLIGRLFTPVTPDDFPSRILSHNQLHGFITVHDLINEINRGPPRWITKKQALGLLYNAQMFSVSDVNEDNKKDGLICVIDSTKCPISSTLGGYSVVTNVQSSENFIGKMKEKGVEIDWFEVRGKLWSRRRLVLRGGDGMFHLLQWKRHHNTETTGAAARAASGEAHELPHGNSGASTSGETTQGLGLEMKALIQNVCLQFDQFQAKVSIQLSEINSHVQRIDSRVQSIEQQLSSTPTMGSTLIGRQSSSGSGEDKEV